MTIAVAARMIALAMRVTGADFCEESELRDGTRVTVRHIRPDDAAELKRGFDRLSPTSRYRRFLAGVSSLTEAQLRYLTNVDGEDHVALVAAMIEPGPEREIGVGVARFIRVAGEPTVAEAAITVTDDLHRRGIGKLLAVTLARAARERGIERFRGEILADNGAARQLLEEVGANIVKDADGNLTFDVALEETPASPRQEMIARRLLQAASTFVFGALRRFS